MNSLSVLLTLAMGTNPYQPPTQEGFAVDPSIVAVRRLRGPSTGLMLLLALQILGYIFAGVIAAATIAMGMPSEASPVGLCLAVGHLLLMIFMVRSMLHIRRLQRLRTGRIAAGIACVPILTPLYWFGIPFGIWLMVVLTRPSTAEAFREAH